MLATIVIGLCATAARGQGDDPLTALRAEVEALRDGAPAWRAIAWESCALEGAARARREGRPLLVWLFIDRPADDARC